MQVAQTVRVSQGDRVAVVVVVAAVAVVAATAYRIPAARKKMMSPTNCPTVRCGVLLSFR